MSELEVRLLDLQVRLRANPTNSDLAFWGALNAEAESALAEAMEGLDAAAADRAWFLNRVAQSYGGYVACFEQMCNGAFYEAWCGLERVEIALMGLFRNPIFSVSDFSISDLQARVARWQSLYPYKVFFSPGFLHKKKECSLCHVVVTPWSSCEHEVGKVYAGRECFRIVTESEFVEISLVLDPVQKYSVALAGRDKDGNPCDHHDHSIAQFLVERLASPFDNWSADWTEALHPHAMFPDATPNGACPCGSGRAYRKCCLERSGVIRQRQDDNRLAHGLDALDDGPQAMLARARHGDAAPFHALETAPDAGRYIGQGTVAIARDTNHGGDNLDGRERAGRAPQGRCDGLG